MNLTKIHPLQTLRQRLQWKQLPEYIKYCMCSTLMIGILAHGVALVTKFSMMDDAHYLFSVGSTTVSGRWFLEILGSFVRCFFGSPNFSLPLLGGLITILLSGLCGCVLISWMELKKKISWILAGGIIVTFPVMSGLFFYHFTSPYYMIGLLFIFLGSALLCRKRNVGAFAGSVLLVCLGISIYQAFIPLFLALLLVSFFRQVMNANHWNVLDLLKEILWYCGACIAVVLVYLISVKVSTSLIKESLLDYKGISGMGAAGISDYIHRIKLAVYLYFFPTKSDRFAFLFPYRLLDCYYLTIIGIFLFGILAIVHNIRSFPLKSVTLLLVLVFFPIAVNFIYITCDAEDIYTLMLFGQMAPFLFLLCLLDWSFPALSTAAIWRYSQKISAVILTLFTLFCIRTDNAVYEKAQFVQTRTQAYFNTMITQIKSTPGYTSSTPVVLVGEYFTDPTYQRIDGFAQLTITPLPYDASPFCIGYSWQDFLTLWCGFTPPYGDADEFSQLPEVISMPCYPNDGSVQLVNGTVVVKLR